MRAYHLFRSTMILLFLGCSSANRGDHEVIPRQSNNRIVFEISNNNLHSGYARVYITDRNCSFGSASRYVEIRSGGRELIYLMPYEFNPAGFAILVRLTGGVSGMDVVETMCTEGQSSPLPGSRVVLNIPSSLRHLLAPGVFPRE